MCIGNYFVWLYISYHKFEQLLHSALKFRKIQNIWIVNENLIWFPFVADLWIQQTPDLIPLSSVMKYRTVVHFLPISFQIVE